MVSCILLFLKTIASKPIENYLPTQNLVFVKNNYNKIVIFKFDTFSDFFFFISLEKKKDSIN